MDIQKEREAFEAYIKSIYPMGEQLAKDCGKTLCELYSSEWQAWQEAKAQAMPEDKQFNLDEFLKMEEKIKHKGGVITADLDRFIAYAEMVLEKAKALKEPK